MLGENLEMVETLPENTAWPTFVSPLPKRFFLLDELIRGKTCTLKPALPWAASPSPHLHVRQKRSTLNIPHLYMVCCLCHMCLPRASARSNAFSYCPSSPFGSHHAGREGRMFQTGALETFHCWFCQQLAFSNAELSQHFGVLMASEYRS